MKHGPTKPRMRMLAIFALVVSCGGDEFSGGSADGGPDGGGGSDGAGGTALGGAAGSAGTGGSLLDAGPDATACVTMRAEVVRLQQAAQSCSPDVAGQCIDEVQSFCCSIVVASKSSQATATYLSALTNYLQKCGPEACLGMPCTTGSGACTPVGTSGTCTRLIAP